MKRVILIITVITLFFGVTAFAHLTVNKGATVQSKSEIIKIENPNSVSGHIAKAGPAEDVVYTENFDSGMGAWSGDWALTNESYHSPDSSLTDSPGGDYGAYDTLTVELTTAVDLSSYLDARLEFWTKYDLENGFDYVYMYISSDGGSTWNLLHTFNGEGVDWYAFETSLGGYAGQSVNFKFTLISDGAYQVDGMYIDDFTVYGSTEDNSPPLIVHQGPTDSTSVPDDYVTVATVTDVSGVQSVTLSYNVDGGDLTVINPDSTVGDNYYFTIPQVEAGAKVTYFFTATDTQGNSGDSDEYSYYSGTILYYDDGEPEYIYQFAPGTELATRMSPTQNATLVTGMYRLYTDVDHDLDTIDVEVWDDRSGEPGSEMITPFGAWPQSTLDDPQAWSYIDFRGMDIEVSSDFWLGFIYRSDLPVILGDDPAVANRSMSNDGGTWTLITTDLDIRAIVDYHQGLVNDGGGSVPGKYILAQNYPNPFNAETKITYNLNSYTKAKLEVYNLIGRKVATLVDESQSPGRHSVIWNASNQATGIYFYKLTVGEESYLKKMILLK